MERPVNAQAVRRVLIVGRLALLWALCITGRLVYLQVYKHEDFQKTAKSQHQHQFPLPADRGEILDRTETPLAISIRTESAVVNPQRIKDAEFFARVVAPALGLNPEELKATLKDYQERGAARARGRGYLSLKRHLTPEEKDRLKYLTATFPLEIIRDSRREYPAGSVGAHIVGSLDSEGNGNSGLEQKLNDTLKGKPGKMLVLTGAQMDQYIRWVSEDSTQGENFTLAMHRVIQNDVEQFLAEGVKDAGAESGSVVVLDPRNGEVLALANYPNFDPRNERPTLEEAKARRSNTAVQIPCEPGSVMKMITVTMGIDSGEFTETTPIFCENGAFARPGRKAIHDVHRMGAMDTAGVLIKSSNIGVAKISIRMGPRMLYEYLKKFGIGDKTGIELPAESRGMLRHLECRGPKDNYCWSPTSHEYIAFGHEVGATSVQLARAVAVIANGGLIVQPHLIMKKTRPRADGKLEEVALDIKKPERVLRAETAFRIRRIMQQVVLEGTGRRAAVPGYSSGGKTGSAEIFENGAWQNKHNSSFIGFAPVTDPRVVVVVTLNRTPKQGGIASAPVFSKVAATALRVLQVPKDEPEKEVAPPQPKILEVNELPENRIAKAIPQPKEKPQPQMSAGLLIGPTVPDFRGKAMLDVLRESAALGLQVQTKGRGVARNQAPAAGTVLPAGASIHVEFATPQ
ncbi:MAG TPA: penicillin-binding protein [Paludibaculum sp.]|jgi:cell division protein FtsI (penicillin-binding protein 3)